MIVLHIFLEIARAWGAKSPIKGRSMPLSTLALEKVKAPNFLYQVINAKYHLKAVPCSLAKYFVYAKFCGKSRRLI